MKPEIKQYNYIHLGLQATFLYLSFNFFRALFHELGHGVAALCVGLEFKGFYAAVFGSSGAWINGVRSPFQSVVISSAGPLVDLMFGLVILYIIFPRMKKWSSRLPWLLLSLIAVFNRSASENQFSIPTMATYTGGGAFIVTCIVWLVLFGSTIQNARGIFFN